MKSFLGWAFLVTLVWVAFAHGPRLLRQWKADQKMERICRSDISYVREGCTAAIIDAFKAGGPR